jgi:hypothetical protein
MEQKSVVLLEDKVVIYQRERSSIWQARVKLADGKWHRQSTREHKEADAKEKALEIYYDARAKAKNNLPQATRRFSNVAKMAIEQMEKELNNGRGKVVYTHYIAAINNYLIPYFGKMKMDNIDVERLNDFERWREEIIGKTIALSTLNTHNSAMNRIVDLAVQHGWMMRSSMPPLKNKGKKPNTRPTFTFAEYRSLTRRLRDWSKTGRTQRTRMMRELLRDYVLVLANTGIRHGTESLNIKWRHIDWHEDINGDKYLQITVDGKTGKRTLIARHNVVTYLTRLKNRFDALKDMTLDEIIKKRIDEYVFRLADGTRTENLNQSFEQFLSDTDLLYGTTSDKKRTLYSLRHFYATYQLIKNTSMHKLAVQMGTSIQMLEKHYSKLTPQLMAKEFAGERYRR